MLTIKEKIQIDNLIKKGLDKESAHYLIKNKSINPDEVNHLLILAYNPIVTTPTHVNIEGQLKDSNFVRHVSKSSWLGLCNSSIDYIQTTIKEQKETL